MTSDDDLAVLPFQHIHDGAATLKEAPTGIMVWAKADAMKVDRSRLCYLNPEAVIVRDQFSSRLSDTGRIGTVGRIGIKKIGSPHSTWEVTLEHDQTYNLDDSPEEEWIKVGAIKTSPPRPISSGRD